MILEETGTYVGEPPLPVYPLSVWNYHDLTHDSESNSRPGSDLLSARPKDWFCCDRFPTILKKEQAVYSVGTYTYTWKFYWLWPGVCFYLLVMQKKHSLGQKPLQLEALSQILNSPSR